MRSSLGELVEQVGGVLAFGFQALHFLASARCGAAEGFHVDGAGVEQGDEPVQLCIQGFGRRAHRLEDARAFGEQLEALALCFGFFLGFCPGGLDVVERFSVAAGDREIGGGRGPVFAVGDRQLELFDFGEILGRADLVAQLFNEPGAVVDGFGGASATARLAVSLAADECLQGGIGRSFLAFRRLFRLAAGRLVLAEPPQRLELASDAGDFLVEIARFAKDEIVEDATAGFPGALRAPF